MTDTQTKQALPIFYSNPVLLDQQSHQDLSLNSDLKFTFAKNMAAVPVNVVELPLLMKDYPVLFIGENPTTLAVIMGLSPDQNLFISHKGDWEEGKYIPAYVRRYPFILSENEQEQNYSLCVDHNDQTIQQSNDNPFFNKDKPSEMTLNAMEFCKSYHQACNQTANFCALVEELNLLSPFNHHLLDDLGLENTRVIDEEKINKLSDQNFLALRKKQAVPFLYAQLFSMNNWQKLYEKTL